MPSSPEGSESGSDSEAAVPPFRCECPREFAGTLCERFADVCVRAGGNACSANGQCENVWGGHRWAERTTNIYIAMTKKHCVKGQKWNILA